MNNAHKAAMAVIFTGALFISGCQAGSTPQAQPAQPAAATTDASKTETAPAVTVNQTEAGTTVTAPGVNVSTDGANTSVTVPGVTVETTDGSSSIQLPGGVTVTTDGK